MDHPELTLGVGGAAGDGVASAGNTLALAVARQGLGVYAYNSYQSVIRGGHSWLRLRVSADKPLNHGDQVDCAVALNQDTLDRHLRELPAGGLAVFNAARVKPAYEPPPGVRLCPLPVPALCPAAKDLPVMQNTVAVGAVLRLMGLDFAGLESVLKTTFAKKPQVVAANVDAARAGFEYAARNFPPLARQLAPTARKWALVTGNEMLSMAAAAAGCKFYSAYPMSPASGVLHWMAAHGKELGICVRQVEDEISVINMAIGANHAGARGMCATSGGGFALMTEALGLAAILETPLVVINVQRAGPSTGVPTKTEQGDLNQAHRRQPGRLPAHHPGADQHPGLLRLRRPRLQPRRPLPVPRHRAVRSAAQRGQRNLDPAIIVADVEIDRGELITTADGHAANGEPYLRYKNTPSGVSPRAVPGVPGLCTSPPATSTTRTAYCSATCIPTPCAARKWRISGRGKCPPCWTTWRHRSWSGRPTPRRRWSAGVRPGAC